MIDFMVIARPRSATTWTANWLTTDRTICLHDPLEYVDLASLDKVAIHGRSVGVADTGLYRLPDYVNAHPARKVVIDRDVGECAASLERAFAGETWPDPVMDLDAIECEWRYSFAALFERGTAKEIYEYLTGLSFDERRWRLLLQMHVEPVHVAKREMQLAQREG